MRPVVLVLVVVLVLDFGSAVCSSLKPCSVQWRDGLIKESKGLGYADGSRTSSIKGLRARAFEDEDDDENDYDLLPSFLPASSFQFPAPTSSTE